MTTKLNILYCEDDHFIREATFSNIIQAFPNSNITICTDGVEGKKKVQESEFQLVISDYDMGIKDGDGISLYKAFREKNPNALFVIFSGQPESEFSELFTDSNFLYFSKGGTLEKGLQTKIRRFFDRAVA